MKKILIGIAILALIAGVAVFVLVGNLDKIVKGSLETIGSDLLGVPVKVASVNIELKSGTGQISGLSIANPSGFPAANAFQMDTIRLGINIKSLGKQPLVINELIIKDPNVRLDVKKDGSSNLQKLMATMKENSKQESTAKTEETAAPQKENKKEDALRLAFGTLSVTGVTVEVNQEGKAVEKVVIPNIVQQNVGGSAGLAPAEVGELVVESIIASSLQTALEKKLSEKLEEATGDFFNKIKGAFGSDKN